ncbi:MAG TPA: hypothetical protein VGT08_05225 [Terracidiphilus sp.]|nr:hypothetical protein [Terracidiphilus sp.]
MRIIWILTYYLILILAAFTMVAPRAAHSQSVDLSIKLQDDQAVSLRFYGSTSADLFTREVEDSFQGVLRRDFYARARDGFPAGFVSASLPGMPWAGTMWTRDAGTFMRELVMRGYYQHAALLAECLMHLVEKNQDGFYAFPRYFKASEPGSGTEFDGTGAIVIGMVLLWERLPEFNPTRRHIQEFLFQNSSPVNYFKLALESHPLIAGTGEFGCGMRIPGECYNVVQNDLIMLALIATSEMADESGSFDLAREYRHLAAKVRNGMEKYLVDKDGSWIWCVDAKTVKPNPTTLNAPVNLGSGSLNGVASMYADVLGFLPLASSKHAIQRSEQTFQDLYNTPLRKTEFSRYGIWTQNDVLAAGLGSSPSYGQGYAIQAMLLFDKLAMAEKALSWLANATYNPVPEYKLHRESPYYFYERTYSPDAVGKVDLVEGCGALNLVNVSEPLKVSRLLLGVDDLAPHYVRIIPRIPPSWRGVEASNWPIRTQRGVVRASIMFERKGTGAELTLKLAPGQLIDDLKVRMPSGRAYVWFEQKHASTVHFVTQ